MFPSINATPTGMDFAALAGAVDFADVLTGLGTVAAAIVVVYVAIRGARILLGFVRR